MAEKMEIEKKKCLTPEFRVSFPHVFEKHTGFQGQEAKFSIVMLFTKKTDLKELKRAAFNAATEKWGDKTKWPKQLRMPFRDGDEKSDLMGYEGTIFVSASSKQKPQVVGNKKIDGQFPQLTKEDEQFYAGCYARATLIAFAYDKAGNKGVSFSLQNVQKLKDGEQFSGRKNADDEFDEVEDESDDAANYGDKMNDADEMGF
jgi:hypothetical protein